MGQPNIRLSDDAEYWVTVMDSNDYRAVEEFLKLYPDSIYKGRAIRKLEDLTKPKPGTAGKPSKQTAANSTARPQKPTQPVGTVEPALTDFEKGSASGTGVAIIGGEQSRAEATRNAKALARSHAIAMRLGLNPTLPTAIALSADAVEPLRFLSRGLSTDEEWTIKQVGAEMRVELQTMIRPLPNGRLLSGHIEPATIVAEQPIRLKVTAKKEVQIGVYAWQADGSVLRIYPDTSQRNGVQLRAGETVTFPRANDPYPNITSQPMPGERANLEAFMVVTGGKETLAKLTELVAPTVTTTASTGGDRRVEDAEFLNRLATISDPDLEVLVLPYVVRAAPAGGKRP